MTQIVHIWTEDINIISAEGRVSRGGRILTDELLKIHARNNLFVAHSHDVGLGNERYVPNEIEYILNTCNSSDPSELIELMVSHLLMLNADVVAKLFVGGQCNGNMYCYEANTNSNEIIDRKAENHIGVNLSYSTIPQKNRLLEILNDAMTEEASIGFMDFYSYHLIDEATYVSILNEFHNTVYNDAIANHQQSTGHRIDIGIIRNGQFRWLQSTNNIVMLKR